MCFSKGNFGEGSLLVWGAFSSSGNLELYFSSNRMNNLDYQSVLSDGLLPYIAENSDKNLIFEQDNAAIHVSGSTRQWFDHQNIKFLDWPTRSPYMMLWRLLVRQVYAVNKHYESIE